MRVDREISRRIYANLAYTLCNLCMVCAATWPTRYAGSVFTLNYSLRGVCIYGKLLAKLGLTLCRWWSRAS